MERENAWNGYETEELKKVDALNQEYRTFLNEGKTERECVKLAVKMAEEAGYRDLKEVIAQKETLKAGDKVYAVGMKKMISLFQIGKKPLEEGMAILGAHIDSPRLDIKQNPLYEEGGFAYLDTHYYGGIKKYQWVTLPLAIHGVIAKNDGTIVDVCIGEDENDPVVGISDLLIHLSADQLDKKAAKVIEGENLDVTLGNMPLFGEEKDAVKANVLKLLKERRKLDIIKGFTTKGIHRDDFLIYINGKETSVYGSQGQNRTAMLSLKLSELNVVYDEIGEYPILLLDDFMSELDSKRRKSFLENVRDTQVIITCTEKISIENLKTFMYNVKKGKVYQE